MAAFPSPIRASSPTHRASRLLIAAATAATLTLVGIAAHATPQNQVVAPPIAAMPGQPSPFAQVDWVQRARAFDAYAFDWTDRGACTTIREDPGALNMEAGTTGFKMPAYYCDTRTRDAQGQN